MRALTYGPEYAFGVSCRSDACRARIDWEVDLTKLPVRPLSEESRRPTRRLSRLRTSPARRTAVAPWLIAAASGSARLRQAAVRIPFWLHPACRHTRGRPRPGRSRKAAALCATTTHRLRAHRAQARRLGTHRLQARVRRRNPGGGDGPTVSAVTARYQRASTTLSHREVRRRTCASQRVARAHQTTA